MAQNVRNVSQNPPFDDWSRAETAMDMLCRLSSALDLPDRYGVLHVMNDDGHGKMLQDRY
jgi:hypothetical protein